MPAHPTCPTRSTEDAHAAIETLGVTVAVLALVSTMGITLASSGRNVADALGERMSATVVGRTRAYERTWSRSGGEHPPRLAATSLRPGHPTLDHAARRWSRQGARSYRSVAGTGRHRARADLCVLCAALSSSHRVTSGGEHDGDGARAGIGAAGSLSARLALARADAAVQSRHRAAGGVVTADATAGATIGAEAEVRGQAHLGRAEQQVDVRAGAMAGARLQGAGSFGVSLLGISIEQSVELEGWAGAGARVKARVRHTRTGVSWQLGWAAALGLGGGGEWGGSVDVADLARHRRNPRRTAPHTSTRRPS